MFLSVSNVAALSKGLGDDSGVGSGEAEQPQALISISTANRKENVFFMRGLFS